MSVQPAQRLPGFEVYSTTGQCIRSIQYRQRCNLMLVFLGCASRDAYLDALVGAAEQLRYSNTQLVAFVPHKEWTPQYPFAVVCDPERRLFERFGVDDDALVLADRFGIIRRIFWIPEPLPLPEVHEVLEWVEFIDLHCHDMRC